MRSLGQADVGKIHTPISICIRDTGSAQSNVFKQDRHCGVRFRRSIDLQRRISRDSVIGNRPPVSDNAEDVWGGRRSQINGYLEPIRMVHWIALVPSQVHGTRIKKVRG